MMKKYIVIYLSFITTCFLYACREHDTSAGGKPDPVSPILQGSFGSKFSRYAKGDVFPGQADEKYISKIWSDTAWQNDRIHKQLFLWSKGADCNDLTYEISSLKNGNSTIPGGNVQLRFCSYVKGDALALECGMQVSRTATLLADALSPVPVNSLPADDPLKIWITVNVPANTIPGRYTGNITVKSAGKEQAEFTLEVWVLNRTLPPVADWTFHLDLWQFPFQLARLIRQEGNGVELFSSRYFELIRPYYAMLADAGQSAITAYIKDGAFNKGESMVKWTRKKDGSWDFDYSDFDKHVGEMMQWGINKQINCFSLAGWHNSIGYYDEASARHMTLDIEPGQSGYAVIWDTFLSSFHTHLIRKGWFGKTVLYMDEIEESGMEKVIGIIKNNHSDWKIGLSGSHISAATESCLYDYSSILGSKRNRRTPVSTFYTSCSQTIPNSYVSRQNSTSEMTWMGWYAAANDFDGYLRWAYDYWTESDPYSIQDGSNTAGDFSMIYRSANTLSSYPVSSMRMELLREGIQDYEKIKILSSPRIKACLERFDETSGIHARKLVEQGQSLLKLIASEN